ncbi:hypothetical protein [Sinomonas sp. P47F7]|uniref:hypothetical protein n=1 Tax=Sinomonas sp. P47F7 TaxID=3410987 RepID=UPI003BF518AC
MGTNADNARLVAAAVTKYIGTKDKWPTSGGYGERVDLALINAPLTIQAKFGSQQKDGTFNGVRGAVERYRNAYRDLDSGWLEHLANQDEQHLIALTNKGKLNGQRSKASAIIESAGAFVGRGLETRDEILADIESARSAYVGVKGLGNWTFEYFTMLIGEESAKPDIWITRFTSRALGRQVSHAEAFELVKGGCEGAGVRFVRAGSRHLVVRQHQPPTRHAGNSRLASRLLRRRLAVELTCDPLTPRCPDDRHSPS